jgi:hypothetical protein
VTHLTMQRQICAYAPETRQAIASYLEEEKFLVQDRIRQQDALDNQNEYASYNLIVETGASWPRRVWNHVQLLFLADEILDHERDTTLHQQLFRLAHARRMVLGSRGDASMAVVLIQESVEDAYTGVEALLSQANPSLHLKGFLQLVQMYRLISLLFDLELTEAYFARREVQRLVGKHQDNEVVLKPDGSLVLCTPQENYTIEHARAQLRQIDCF